MAVGTPILITNGSGCQEYATEETATLIEPNKFIVYPEMDMYPQFSLCPWANVEVTDVACKMRYIVEHQSEIKAKAQVGLQFVHDKFCYAKTIERFDGILKTLF